MELPLWAAMLQSTADVDPAAQKPSQTTTLNRGINHLKVGGRTRGSGLSPGGV
jgi:hypothetical protein